MNNFEILKNTLNQDLSIDLWIAQSVAESIEMAVEEGEISNPEAKISYYNEQGEKVEGIYTDLLERVITDAQNAIYERLQSLCPDFLLSDDEVQATFSIYERELMPAITQFNVQCQGVLQDIEIFF